MSKERPILFSGPMMRAILEGRKTQTRRVVKPQPPARYQNLWPEFNGRGTVGPIGWFWSKETSGSGAEQQDLIGINPCPYGRIGDRLWVRETWLPFDRDHRPPDYAYRADVTPDGEDVRQEHIRCGRNYRWRPSIHMPRAASRITLEMTSVRVERLQGISEADAMAEGCERIELGPHEIGGIPVHPMTSSYFEAFRKLWQSINGPEFTHPKTDRKSVV